MVNGQRQDAETESIPDDVADAWAALLMGVAEKFEAEECKSNRRRADAAAASDVLIGTAAHLAQLTK